MGKAVPPEFYGRSFGGGADDASLEVEIGAAQGEFDVNEGAGGEAAVGDKQDAGAADIDAGAADPFDGIAGTKAHRHCYGVALRSIDGKQGDLHHDLKIIPPGDLGNSTLVEVFLTPGWHVETLNEKTLDVETLDVRRWALDHSTLQREITRHLAKQ